MLAHELVYAGIGGRTIEELNDPETGMTADEFLSWAAFFALEPRGDRRRDWLTAMLLHQQANMNRAKGKSRLPLGRFLPKWRTGLKHKQTPEEAREALRANYVALGGKPAGVEPDGVETDS